MYVSFGVATTDMVRPPCKGSVTLFLERWRHRRGGALAQLPVSIVTALFTFWGSGGYLMALRKLLNTGGVNGALMVYHIL